MSTDRDVTSIVRSWLEEGATALPDRVLDTVLDRLPATSQRRAWRPAWRFREMRNVWKLAIAAAAVVVVAIAGINLLPGRGGVGVAVPSPTPSPTPSPIASPSPSPSPASFPDGPLSAGSYAVQPFVGWEGVCAGQVGCTESGTNDDSIRITFTLPDGWSGFGGAVIRTVEGYSPPGGASLFFMRGAWLYSKLCGGPGPDIPTGTTVDEFVTALVKHPDLDVTRPVPVSLGGYSGQYLELTAPANIATNPDNPAPGECAGYFVWEPGIYAQGPNQTWHIWVLDVGGVRVVVRSDTFPGTTAAVKAQLTAIVASIQIES